MFTAFRQLMAPSRSTALRLRFFPLGAGPRVGRSLGFTLIEALITVAVLGILASIAYPAYTSYINKSRARSAAADLSAAGLVMENRYQLGLVYPTFTAGASMTSTNLPGWSPTQTAYFDYTFLSSASTTYSLRATGKGGSTGCTLTYISASTPTATSACGFTSW